MYFFKFFSGDYIKSHIKNNQYVYSYNKKTKNKSLILNNIVSDKLRNEIMIEFKKY